jgi:hypothetical protein
MAVHRMGPHSSEETSPAGPRVPKRGVASRIDRIDFDAPWAQKLSRLIALSAGIAAAAAWGVVGYTSLIGPFPAVAALLVPGVPLLALGQLWCIAILLRRTNDRRRLSRNAGNLRSIAFTWLADLRGGLPRPIAAVFLILFYGAALLGATSAFWGIETGNQLGVPTDDVATCEYSSNNHGVYRCLTKAEHEQEQANQQRSAASALAAFYIAHCGIATSEVLLRRRPRAGQPL